MINHKKPRIGFCMITLMALMSVLSTSVLAAPARGLGRAVIAGMTENAYVRSPTTTVHDGGSEKEVIEEGLAYTEGHTLETDREGRLCVVLTPGAVVCVGGNSKIKIVTLREMPKGLPTTEQELVRTINLSMKAGSLLFYGGTPSPNKKFKVLIPGGAIETSGSTFECHEKEGRWITIVREGDASVVTKKGTFPIAQGQFGTLAAGNSGNVEIEEGDGEDFGFDAFELCDQLYPYLDPLVFHVSGIQLGTDPGNPGEFDLPDFAGMRGESGVDIDGVADFVPGGDIFLQGEVRSWSDVSPSRAGRSSTPDQRFTTPGTETATPGTQASTASATGAGRGAANRGESWGKGRLRPRIEMWNWYEETGVIKGVNYIPRDAVNSIEMWQESTFNLELIEEELEWAQDAGYNAVRVQLSYTVWQNDSEAYLERIEDFLDEAKDHDLNVGLVLLDDSRRAKSPVKIGPQPEATPGVYNSQWVPSPVAEVVVNPEKWAEVEGYVRGIIGHFAKDKRILFWDVYHAPGYDDLWQKSLPLLESAFVWARNEEPRQPLTAGPWTQYMSPMSVRVMELSDFISLQTFDDVEGVKSKIQILAQFDRPIICTDWLKRGNSNNFENILPVFAEQKIGWFSRGLVKGETQFHLADQGETVEEGVWQQNVLNEDGAAYDEDEIEMIRDFNF